MGLKSHTLVLFVAFTLLICGITESRNIRGHSGGDNVHSIYNNPRVRSALLNAVLESRGTSTSQILERLIAADGDVEVAVSGINAELQAEVLRVDGDLVRVNQEEIANLLTDGIKAILREKFGQNPFLADLLEKRLEQVLASKPHHSQENNAIPLSKIRELLEKSSLQRSKRDAAAGGLDLGAIITQILGNVLRGQLSGLITTVLEQVKTVLQGLYISTAPASGLDSILAFVVNTLVKNALDVIALVQQNLEQIISILPAPVVPTNSTVTARRKREVEDYALTAPGTNDGMLAPIIGPILQLLANILTPINQLIKTLTNGILNGLTPLLGTGLVTSIGNLIFAIVDLLLPSNPTA